jgi:hypothetical protein
MPAKPEKFDFSSNFSELRFDLSPLIPLSVRPSSHSQPPSKIERKRKRHWWQGQSWRIFVAALLAVVTVILGRKLVAFFRYKYY